MPLKTPVILLSASFVRFPISSELFVALDMKALIL